jgi:hypothetical protein
MLHICGPDKESDSNWFYVCFFYGDRDRSVEDVNGDNQFPFSFLRDKNTFYPGQGTTDHSYKLPLFQIGIGGNVVFAIDCFLNCIDLMRRNRRWYTLGAENPDDPFRFYDLEATAIIELRIDEEVSGENGVRYFFLSISSAAPPFHLGQKCRHPFTDELGIDLSFMPGLCIDCVPEHSSAIVSYMVLAQQLTRTYRTLIFLPGGTRFFHMPKKFPPETRGKITLGIYTR